MLKRTVIALALIVSVMAGAGTVHAQDKLQDYFSDLAVKVKAAEDPARKRALLDESFVKMTKVLDAAEKSPLLSKDDKAGIAQVRAVINDRQAELAGVNGFERVTDDQLDAFASFVVQDMEQADDRISISLTAFLLIIIIIILLA
jgi:hypothetical protein